MPSSVDDPPGMPPGEQLQPAAARDAPVGAEAENVFLKRLLESLPYPVTYIDADLIYRQCNAAAAATVGRTSDEIVGQSVAAVVGAESEVIDVLRRVLTSGEPHSGTVEFTAPGSSSAAFYRASYLPDIDAEGKVIGVLTNVVDVTDLVRSERRLRASEDRLSGIARAGGIGFVEYNVATDEAYWSPEHYELFGFENGTEVDWRRWLEGVHAEDRERVEASAARMLERAFAEGGVRRHKDEYRIVRSDGTMAWIEADMSVDIVDGQAVVRGAVRDATERRQVEEALRESEQRFRLALRAGDVIVAICDRELRYVWIHDPHPDFDASTVVGKRDTELADNDATRRLEALKQRVIDTGVGARSTVTFPLSEGPRTYDVQAEPHMDDSGSVTAVTTIAVDVTRSHLAEEALKQALTKAEAGDRMLRALMANVPEGITICDVDGELRMVSQYGQDLLGSPHTGKSIEQVVQEWTVYRPDGQTVMPVEELPLSRALAGETVRDVELVQIDARGRTLPLLCNAAPIRDAEGGVVAAIVAWHDISARKRADALARERLAEIEDLYRNAPIGLCVLDRDLRFLRINERLAEINGIPAADHIGKTVRELLPALAAEVEPGMRQVLDTGEPRRDIEIISETLAQPGRERTWLEQWLPTRDSEGHITGLSIVVEEITERRQAEKALRESEENFRSLLRSSRDVLLRIDVRTGRYDYISPAVESMTGFAPDELMQMGREASLVLVHPDDLPRLADAVRATLEDGLGAAEYRQRTKSGEYRWLSNSMVLVRDEDGEPLYRIGNLRDVTDERQAEAALREHEADRAVQQERGRLARDLHDSVTQSLFAATLKAEALSLAVGDQAPGVTGIADELTRLSRGALAQMRTMLLELRGDPVEEVPLYQLLRNLVEAAESRASARVRLDLGEDATLPADVHKAVYRITQEALNNVSRHARAQNAWVELDHQPLRTRLVIGDDGCGFDPGSVEPGHFGLKSVRERADDSGGQLSLRSVQGEGTTLTVEWRLEESARKGAAG